MRRDRAPRGRRWPEHTPRWTPCCRMEPGPTSSPARWSALVRILRPKTSPSVKPGWVGAVRPHASPVTVSASCRTAGVAPRPGLRRIRDRFHVPASLSHGQERTSELSHGTMRCFIVRFRDTCSGRHGSAESGVYPGALQQAQQPVCHHQGGPRSAILGAQCPP